MAKSKERCEVHGTELIRQKVPLSYGLPRYDPAWEVKSELFPNSYSKVLGGCSIDFSLRSETFRLICSDCRDTEEKWRRENNA